MATSTPAEKLRSPPLSMIVEISGFASTACMLSSNSSIISKSIMLSGGWDSVICARPPEASRVRRLWVVAMLIWISTTDACGALHQCVTPSAGPETFLVVVADSFQFRFIRIGRGLPIGGYFQLPASIGNYVIHPHGGMNGRDISLGILTETQHALGGNHSRRTSTGQAHTLTPSQSFAMARTGDVSYPLRQAMFTMLKERYKAMGHGCDIARPTRTRQAHDSVFACHLGRVQVAIFIDLGC